MTSGARRCFSLQGKSARGSQYARALRAPPSALCRRHLAGDGWMKWTNCTRSFLLCRCEIRLRPRASAGADRQPASVRFAERRGEEGPRRSSETRESERLHAWLRGCGTQSEATGKSWIERFLLFPFHARHPHQALSALRSASLPFFSFILLPPPLSGGILLQFSHLFG